MARLITPLVPNVPIVDKQGNPTPYFSRLLDEISDAKISASVIDALGGDPGGDRVVVWDTATSDLAFMTTSEALDFITGASHGDILFRGSAGWETLDAGTAGQVLQTNGTGADPEWVDASTSVQYERTRTIPTASQFTLQNAGTASVSDSTYGMVLNAPAAASNIRFLKQNAALPGASWTMIVRMRSLLPWSDNQRTNYGLCFRNSSNGRIVWFMCHSGATSMGVGVQRYTNYTTFSANSFAPSTAYWISTNPWWRIVCNGTTLSWSISPDGEAWSGMPGETIATFLTAAGGSLDQIGVGVQTVGQNCHAIFQSYEVA